jgi:hypothetical protein
MPENPAKNKRKGRIMKETKQQTAERLEATEKLRKLLKAGDTVKTILRHRSTSGMYRAISPVVNSQDISWLVSRACNEKIDKNHGGIRMTGCGMDMGFELVYRLSSALFPDGFTCIGNEKRCPSNDHSNGDRNYKQHTHKSGGYALRHEWL